MKYLSKKTIWRFILRIVTMNGKNSLFAWKLFFLLLFFNFSVYAQEEVSGIVYDSNDVPLPSVNVVLKGTKSGVITDFDGNFNIEVQDVDKDVLIFSYVGFETKSVELNGRANLNVTLLRDAAALDEVLIKVPFGEQKRAELVGSVTSISPEELKVPSSNLTTALAGRVAGVISYQRSGEPGADNAEFFIRGVTTFGYKKDPLILIDNIESTTTDLARLNPDDIASFSIMKDATSTALYGARGANGVILISTKQGRKGEAKVTLRIENSISMPTKDIELADPITYMKLNNEAILTRDPLAPLLYSDEKIERTKPGSGSRIYPYTDWKNKLFKDYAMNQRAHLSVRGGGDVAQYYVSGAFNQDNGVLKVDNRNNFNNNINLKSYSLRSNINVNLTPTTELITRLSGSFDDYTGPIYSGGGFYTRVMRANPVLFPAYYPKDEEHRHVNHIMFGNFEDGGYLNPYADMVRGYRENSRSKINAQFKIEQKLGFITKGLKATARFNTSRSSFFDMRRQYNPFYYQLSNFNRREDTYKVDLINPEEGTEYLTYDPGSKTINATSYLEMVGNYNRSFGKSNLSGMLVFTLRESLTANAPTLQESLPYRNVGLAGRATYSFDNRYFAEFNFGYNGSERFYKDKRFGFFPSAGVAWTVSNESFWKPLKETINKLKLRATYGVIGNDALGSGRFLYLSEVNVNDSGRSATFGNNFGYTKNGVSISRYSDRDITWETANKMNLALELGLFDEFELIAEYFREHRTNILQNRASTPASMGLWQAPSANIGEAKGDGVDVSLEYNHSFNSDIWLQARGNFTYATSSFEVYEEYDHPNEPWKSKVGYPINQQWGYIAESLFVDEEEVANSPAQNFGEYTAGDIKYRDVNGDGQITTLDMVPIGYPTNPEIVYGFGFSFGFHDFDFSSFFQGIARESFWVDPAATAPFQSYYYSQGERDSGTIFSNQLLGAYAESHWSEDNRDLYALWPRLSTEPIENNNQRSTWFMRDGSFLRLKQVEVGYTLPHSLTEKWSVSSLRFYLTGTNLYTWSKFNLWDVEMAGNGLRYPLQKVFNVGLQVTF